MYQYHLPPTGSRRRNLRQLEVPDVVQKYRLGYLKSQSLGWCPSCSGDGAHFVPWVGAPLSPGGVPLFLRRESLEKGPVRLDRGPPYSRLLTSRVWGWYRRGEWGSLRRGTPLTLPICPASSWARDRLAPTLSTRSSSFEALHMSWTTRHPFRPTGKTWNVVHPQRENTTCGEPLKDNPAN